MTEYKEHTPTPGQFNRLTDRVSWGKRDENVVAKALERTLYSLCAFDGEKIVGYGRIIGDETIFLYIQDIMVVPEYQGRGVGTGVMKNLLEKIDEYRKLNPRIRVYLGADKGKEGFYEKLGFSTRREAGLGPGMIMWPLPEE